MHENQNIEWKASWKDEYLKWICGFANADGGVLEIGRSDSRHAIGVKNAGKLLVDIPNKVRDVLGIMADVDLIEENGNNLIRIKVEPYPGPVSYKGQYHYRSGSTKQELKGPALEQFLLKKRGIHWDAVIEPRFKITDCLSSAVQDLVERGKRSNRIDETAGTATDEVLDNLELKEGGRLKRAALLLFSQTPERWIGGAWIKLGFLPATMIFAIRMKYMAL